MQEWFIYMPPRVGLYYNFKKNMVFSVVLPYTGAAFVCLT